jgi:hypothetical protein
MKEYENDDSRTEEDLKVLRLLEEWHSSLPKIGYAITNAFYSSLRSRALGGGYGAKHVLDSDYDDLMESFRKKIDKVESELERGLVEIRKFRRKYIS